MFWRQKHTVIRSFNRFKPRLHHFFEPQISILQSVKSSSDFSQFAQATTCQLLIARFE